jgi:hypothetical protein
MINDLCDFVVSTERELRDTFHLAPAEHGALSWKICDQSSNFRIFYMDKPFAESSVLARVQHSGDIPGLIAACDKAMEAVESVLKSTPKAEKETK